MDREAVWLIDVEGIYADAVRAHAEKHELEAIALSGDPPCGDAPALCVVAASRGSQFGPRLSELVAHVRPAPVVVLGRWLDSDGVIEMLRLGAQDVIGLPREPEEVARRALAHRRCGLRDPQLDRIVGSSAVLDQLRRDIASVASLPCTVLLTGETGTGKGLVARVLHDLSPRRRRPFVHVDCAALSPTVIESELFGHERGAFTGALGRKPGRLELAGEGTLFLDEIGDLDPSLQAKLLRALEDREYERVGGTETLCMRARIVAATSRNLAECVRRGSFRSDLYYRLNVFRLRLPPLRERAADVPLLVSVGIHRIARRLGLPTPQVTPAFHERLACHAWSGNVRELMNVLERVLVQTRGRSLDAADLADVLEPGDMTVCRPGSLEAPSRREGSEQGARGDRDSIAAALVATGGNVSRTARRLALPRSTLRYRIRQLGLSHLIPED